MHAVPPPAPQLLLAESSTDLGIKKKYIYIYYFKQFKITFFFLNFVPFSFCFCILPLSLAQGRDISLIHLVPVKWR